MGIDAKIKAIAPWFGGKRTMAPLIVQELGKHTQYFEPFCGSMAVLFAKQPSQKETVNDLHGDLINLALVLQEEESATWLYEKLQRVLFADKILRGAIDWIQSDNSALNGRKAYESKMRNERAYRYFLACWMMRNGVAGTQRMEYQIAVRWTKGGGSPTVRWKNAIESLPGWHQRLSNVVILSRDAFEIIDRFEDVAGTAIYCDPPYFSSSRSGFGKHGKGSKYEHEFEHDNPLFGDDHSRLAEILRRYRKARIVVSYYDCPEIRRLYEGWTFVGHTRQKNLHVQNGPAQGKKEAPEVLVINGPSYA